MKKKLKKGDKIKIKDEKLIELINLAHTDIDSFQHTIRALSRATKTADQAMWGYIYNAVPGSKDFNCTFKHETKELTLNFKK